MAYQSEVSRMLLAVKPSPASAAAGLSHGRAGGGSNCGASSGSSSSLFARVAAAAASGAGGGGGVGSRGKGGSSGASAVGSDGGGSSVLSGEGSSLLRAASSKQRAGGVVVTTKGLGFLRSGGAAGSAAAAAGHSAAAAAAAQQQQQMVVHFRGQQTSVGFLLSKIAELLKQHAGRTLHVKEVEKALIHAGFSHLHLFFQANSEFLKLLCSNERVAYNPLNRTLAFHNPYQAITSCNALLARIRYDGALTGLRVEQELLSATPEMENWINSLLASRRVRAVRVNNNHLRGKKKCLVLAAGNQANPAAACDIYAARKCVNCRQNLVGMLLYPLADDVYEEARMALDAEVKGLWDSIQLPSLEDMITECNPSRGLPRRGVGIETSDKTRFKRQADSKRPSRFRSKFRRIQNTHLFTAEELRAFSDQHNS